MGICCFSAKHTTLWNKGKDWLSRNQNNVSEWSDMSTNRMLFHLASTMTMNFKACLSCTKWIPLSSHRNIICSHYDIAKMFSFGVKQQSLTHFIWKLIVQFIISQSDRRGRDHMVVGFATSYATNAYHHH